MGTFDWSAEKNEWLKDTRGVRFEDVVQAIESGRLLDTIPHPNRARYPRQHIYVVEIGEYIYCVPFVEKDGGAFLKTIYPSRQLQKRYQGNHNQP